MTKLKSNFKRKFKRSDRRKHSIVKRSPILFDKKLNPIAQSYRCTLRYVDNWNWGDATTFSTTVFRTNSLFDPDFTYVGHQPYGYDQLSTLYTGYRVLGFRYKITVTYVGSPIKDIILAVMPTPSATSRAMTYIHEACETPMAKWKQSSYYGNPVTVSGRLWMPSFLGVPYATYMGDGQYSAAVGNNPAIVGSILVAVGTADATVMVTNGIAMTVELDYDAEFIGAKLQAAS